MSGRYSKERRFPQQGTSFPTARNWLSHSKEKPTLAVASGRAMRRPIISDP
ncbi:MAG: hypothetical protein IKQ07_09545 [Bacteroidaceae bacterium]|nr:hypothetical protein [Bacteroidaceae bacterium]